MNKQDAMVLLKQVQENQAKLNSCPGHKFGDVLGDKTKLVSHTFTCQVCGGTMRAASIYIYAKGYKAAGKDPDDVARYVDGVSI